MIRRLITLMIALSASCWGVVGSTWSQVNTPGGATQIRDFEINRSTGCFYLADRISGFWVSCDSGTTWAQRNSGLADTTAWTVTYDSVRNQLILGLLSGGGQNVLFYRTTNDGVTWTSITLPSTSATGWPAYTGGTNAPNNDLLIGFTNGTAGTGGLAYSTNGGTSFTQSSVPVNGSCTAPGGSWGLFLDTVNTAVWLGTEQCGLYKSTDNARTFAACSPPTLAFGGIRDGNAEGIAVDNGGDVFMATQGGLWKAAPGACPLTFTNVFGNGNTSEGRSIYKDSSGTLYYGHKKDTNAPVCPSACTSPTNAGTTTVYTSQDSGVTWAPFSTGLPTLLEAWRFIQSPIDQQMYVYLQESGTAAGTVYRTLGTSLPGPASAIMAKTNFEDIQ